MARSYGPTGVSRRRLLAALAGLTVVAPLLGACAPSAPPTNTPAPAKPAEAPKPAAPAAAAPTNTPLAPVKPTEVAKPAEAAKPTEVPKAAAGAPSAAAGKIVFLNAGNLDAPEEAPRKKVYTDFMAKYPGITWDIRALPGGKDWDRLARTSVSAGEQVDLLAINGQFVKAWFRDNLLYEISSDKEAASFLNRLEPAFLDAASPGGKRYYTVPLASMGGVHVTVLYYNKALLDKASAQPPKTTDDLQALVAPLKGAGASPMVHPSGDVWFNPLLVMWIQPMVVDNKPVEFTERTQKGEVKYNSPEWLKTFQIIADLGKNGALLPGSGAIGNDASIQLLYQGKAAMLYQGSWTYPSLKTPPAGAAFDLHVTGLPIVSPAPRAQPLIAFGGYSIPVASKNRDAAMAFIKFAADPEIDARVVEAVQQFSPMAASNAKITDPVSKEIAPWFKDGVPPLDWLWEPEITTEIQNLVQTLVKGEGAPQAAGDAVQAKAEQLRREGRSYYK